MGGSWLSKASSLFGGGSQQPTTPLPTPPSDTVAQEAAQRARVAAAKK